MRRFAIYRADTMELDIEVRSDRANFYGFRAILRLAEERSRKVAVAVFREDETPSPLLLGSEHGRIVYRTGQGCDAEAIARNCGG